MVGSAPTIVVTGNGKSGFESGERARATATTFMQGSRRANYQLPATYDLFIFFYLQSAMPRRRKGANSSRRTNKSRNMQDGRSQRSGKQIHQENENVRVSMAQLR